MFFNLLLIGIISILGQVVILRELTVAFYGIELIYIIAIGIWLFWTGVGAVLGRKSFLPTKLQITVLFIISGIIIPLDVAFIRGIRIIFGGVPGAYLPFMKQLISITVALAPVCLVLGLLFQWVAKHYVMNKGRTLARAYAIECVGGLIGGLLATLAIQFNIQNFHAVLICGIFSLSAAVLVKEGPFRNLVRISSVLLICLLVLTSFYSSSIDRYMTGWNHPNLVETRDTPYGRVTVRALHNQISIFENDALSFENEGTSAEEFAQLSALQHSQPGEILLLGGGVEGLLSELLKFNPQRIDYVEINEVLLEIAAEQTQGFISTSLENEKVRIIIEDPRKFIARCGKYDLIINAMPEPSSGQSNRFYTQEFFGNCLEKLKSNGVLTLRIRSDENLWTPQLKRRNSSIYRALSTHFNHIIVLPGVTNIIAASSEPLPAVSTLIDRWNAGGFDTMLITPEYIDYLYTNDRFDSIRQVLENESAPVNSDNNPIVFHYTLMIWLSKFYIDLAFKEYGQISDGGSQEYLIYAIVLFVLLIIFLYLRRKIVLRKIALVALAGFAGMIVESLLILHYQTRTGILYKDIGFLLTAFMFGLAIGAYLISRLAGLLVDAPPFDSPPGNRGGSDQNFPLRNRGGSDPSLPLGNREKDDPNIPSENREGNIPNLPSALQGGSDFNLPPGSRGGIKGGGTFRKKAPGILLIVCFSLLNICIMVSLNSNFMSTLPGVALMMTFTGAAVAGLFGYASLESVSDQRRVISPLYSADLIGGCLGSLLGVLIFIPFIGMQETAGLMAILILLSLVLI